MRWLEDYLDRHPRFSATLSAIRPFLPPINFITIHYAYFILVSLVASVVFWGSSNPGFSISYVDSLFLTVSAMTEAGLNTVNLSQMTTWQQIILMLLIMLGSSIWVSIWTVMARKHAFEVRFEAVVRAQRERRLAHKRSHAASSTDLPFMQRFLSFRKAQTVPNPGGLMINGTVPVTQATADGGVEEARGRQPARAAEAEDVVTANPSASDASSPPTRGITFSDIPHPNATAEVNHAVAATGRAHPNGSTPTRRHGFGMLSSSEKHDHSVGDHENMHHFLQHRTPGRNAQFYDLTREEREHLGGCEYRAIKVLAFVVPIYFFLWQLLGCLAVGAWINNYQPGSATGNGVDPWWAGIFNGISAFNNSGMSLLDANMIPFQQATFVLLTMGLMILAGNTAYPIFLRLIFWTGLKLLKSLTPDDSMCDLKATLDFILRYPRRVYTNLFPSRPTWWLLFMVVVLNCIDWFSFVVLDLGNAQTASIPPGARVLDGLFQALAVRSGGFYVVPISSLYIGVQILYVIMMYISAFPVVITIRHSNVYEERSLGIYSDATADNTPEDSEDLERGDVSSQAVAQASRRLQQHMPGTNFASHIGRAIQRRMTGWNGVGVPSAPPGSAPGETRVSFISQQIHGQLAHDIWMLVLAVLVISTIETSSFLADPATYSVFNVIFEVVSAYGTVGISVGLPDQAYSFCGSWHTASKLVLCLVMLRGRHRGLPVALDRAVRLPGEALHREEEEDHRRRRSMSERRISSEI
jgi:potassium uptake Trk family protein